MNLKFYALWAINAALDEAHLRTQIDMMRRWGFDGVVFHPRFYPNVPPYLGDAYLAILSRAILHAKSLGMEFWIYDEDGWPSGTVGGHLLKQHPHDAQQWADLVTEPPPEPLGEFHENGRQWYLARRQGPGVDYLNPQLAHHFIQMTHERYRQGLDPAAWDHVSAIFCDEPEFGLGHAYNALSPHGAIPWTPALPQLFQERYGQKLTDVWPLLFFDKPGHERARVQFWELLTNLFCESFITPINEWCRRQGKRFTAHVKGEEHPLFQIPTHGSAHQVFRHLSLPGIDALERFPSGDFFPRQVASAAQQFGTGDCMVEAFGGAGWGATPADLERYLHWLIGHGINHVVLHLFQYQLTTPAIHDWPASIPIHMTWRNAFPELLRRARTFAAGIQPSARTLVIAPYRGMMEVYSPQELLQTNVHNASTYPDTPAAQINKSFLALIDRLQQTRVPYHVSDEKTLETFGKQENRQLRIGNCAYTNVIVAQGSKLSDAAQQMISRCDATLPEKAPPVMPAANTPSAAVPAEWKVSAPPTNQLVIEAERLTGRSFVARFEASHPIDLAIIFVDAVESPTLNGKSLDSTNLGRSVAGTNEIRFECNSPRLIPFLSIAGRFRVRSSSPFVPGPNGTVATNGPFALHSTTEAHPDDLLSSGFPFNQEPIALIAIVDFPFASTALRLPTVQADCAFVKVDGIDWGWCWAPHWSVQSPKSASPGPHIVEVQLTPSSFNRFGPHHHVDGDPPVVSPMQYEYIKNFADRPDAPQNTRVNAWHFKPLGMKATIEILKSPPIP